MAKTPEGHALTAAHKRLQGQISAATLRDLLTLWQLVDPKNLRGTVDPFTTAAGRLVKQGRARSSVASARYYSAFRQVEGVRGTTVVTTTPPIPDAIVESSVRGAGLAGILNGFRRGLAPDQAHQNGFVKMASAASGLVVGGGRDTISGAIASDPAAEGWQRVTGGDPCAFCAMIASNGIIAKDSDRAAFEAHGGCLCTAEPAYEGSPVRQDNAALRDSWNEATSGLSGADALNAFRRSMG